MESSTPDMTTMPMDWRLSTPAPVASSSGVDPKALRELMPDFESQGAPLESPVTEDFFLYLTPKHAIRSPITPPPLKNHGY